MELLNQLILLPIFIGIFTVLSNANTRVEINSHIRKNHWSFFKIFGGIVLISTIFFAFSHIMPVAELINEVVFSINRGWILSGNARGGFTRVGMISYFIKHPNLHLLGGGIANYEWNQRLSFGFSMFGQSTFGEFLLTGGIILIALYALFIMILYGNIFKNKLYIILVEIFYLSLSIYTVLLTEISATISVSMFIILCLL